MSDFRVTLLAQADVDLAWLYVARDRPAAADRLAERLFEQFGAIVKNPKIGQVCAELGVDIRQSTVGNYVVMYRIRENWVEILRVIHGARDVIAEFRRHWPEI
jgi:toxin ParE1/3/4